MIPTIAEVRNHATGFLKVLQAFVAKEFDLNVDNMVFELDFRKDLAYFGLGGIEKVNGKAVGSMKLSLKKLVNFEVQGFSEYKSLLRYTEVTSFETTDWKIWLENLMCHEMAHVVQYMLPRSTSSLMIGQPRVETVLMRKHYKYVHTAVFKGLGQSEENHSKFFIRIYAILRRQFINARVTPAYRVVNSFVGEDGAVVFRARPTANHPLIGTKFPYKGETFEVKECFPRMRTYPLLAIGETSGKRIRFAPESVRMYSAAENVKLTDGGLILTNNPFAKAA